jgi:hypothetical protein
LSQIVHRYSIISPETFKRLVTRDGHDDTVGYALSSHTRYETMTKVMETELINVCSYTCLGEPCSNVPQLLTS